MLTSLQGCQHEAPPQDFAESMGQAISLCRGLIQSTSTPQTPEALLGVWYARNKHYTWGQARVSPAAGLQVPHRSRFLVPLPLVSALGFGGDLPFPLVTQTLRSRGIPPDSEV